MAPTEDTDFNTSTKTSKQKAFEVNMKSVHVSCRGMGHSGLQNIFVTKQLASSSLQWCRTEASIYYSWNKTTFAHNFTHFSLFK